MLDGVDLHGKWPRGGGGAVVTFEKYLEEVPLLDHKIGKVLKGEGRRKKGEGRVSSYCVW